MLYCDKRHSILNLQSFLVQQTDKAPAFNATRQSQWAVNKTVTLSTESGSETVDQIQKVDLRSTQKPMGVNSKEILGVGTI